MTDLRTKLIRLAHENPNLRADILPLLKKSAASANDALTLRGEIRALEEKVADQIEIYIPSEDMIMDNPKRFTKSLQKAKTLLEKILEAREAYKKVQFG